MKHQTSQFLKFFFSFVLIISVGALSAQALRFDAARSSPFEAFGRRSQLQIGGAGIKSERQYRRLLPEKRLRQIAGSFKVRSRRQSFTESPDLIKRFSTITNYELRITN